MNKMKRLTAFALLMIMLLLSLCSCFPFYYFEKPIKFELSGEVSLKSVYNEEFNCYDVYLDGVAENTTGKDLASCWVSFTLYDNEGNVIGTAEDNLNDLKAGEKWRFSASGSMGYEPASFELDELHGYDQ